MKIYQLRYDSDGSSSGVASGWFGSKKAAEDREQQIEGEDPDAQIYGITEYELKFTKRDILEFLNRVCTAA
jgi:hypothetical protein